MIERVHALLQEIAGRRRAQRLHGGLAILFGCGLVIGITCLKSGLATAAWLPLLGAGLLLGIIAVAIWSRRGTGSPREIALEIERRHPELQTGLLAALDQEADLASGSYSYLQLRVVLEALLSSHREHWLDEIPRTRLNLLRSASIVGLLLLLTAAGLLWVPSVMEKSEAAAAELRADPEVPDLVVDPGDVEIERGGPLTIQARFDGIAPDSATLEITEESGAVRAVAMTRPFTDPVFQVRLSAVPEPMRYRVVLPDGASRVFEVKVFDLPAMQQSEVVLTFPDHLEKPPETIKDPRAIQAEEQTRMDLMLVANLPGLTATLVAKDQEPLELVADSADPSVHRFSMTLVRSVRYEIVLTDAAGRRNPRRETLDIRVLPNKAPVVQVVLPRKDEKATPIQELRLEARISDDSGLVAQGLQYTIDGEEWIELGGQAVSGDQRPLLSEMVDLEAAGAGPKDVVMWNAWAEDIGPDGKVRRVNGDIHLVRVRDFDEEFYQRAAPAGGMPEAGEAASAGQQGAELLKTQTQILNATWSTRRNHAEITRTPPPAEELETLRQSQEVAMETAAGMEQEQTDPSLRQHLTDARLAMKDALAELTEAFDQKSAAPLDEAIRHEQTALRHLYQLMSSRTMVMTGQSQSSSSSSSESPPSEDLDLKPMENPYQAEKEAKPESPAGEAGEAMEILKRLDELAKRQRDLNEEMQALQTAMDQAESAAEKAEIERQLKQLREQQRDLVGDVDELRQKTSDPSSAQADDSEQKEALNEVRERARQAAEDLAENKLGEALANGRRAEESLDELHDDFRETSAARLAEELRELRRQARELEQRQEKLAEAPAPQEADRAPRLSDSAAGDPELQQQKEDLETLLEDVRETAEIAEKAEPLVAQDLAEALRQARQAGLAEALDQAGGRQAAGRATEGISELTREIENAAERILGNEAQALRYARDELERLTEQAAAEANGSPGEGRQPGEGESQESETGRQPGEDPQAGEGQLAEQVEGGQAGEGQGQGQEPQAGEEPAAGQGQGEQAGRGPGQEPGEGGGRGEGGEPGEDRRIGQGPRPGEGGQAGQGGGGNGRSRAGRASPITGEGFEEWTDRLYDLEAVIDDPEAQSAVARAREASRELRRDFKRHSVAPDPAAIDARILQPLAEAAKELDARLRDLKREDPLAPVGSDPVPERYSEVVRRYFEELGK